MNPPWLGAIGVEATLAGGRDTGKNSLRARTKIRIATTKPITWYAEIMKRDLYSLSYLINPPNAPGMWILFCCPINFIKMGDI